MTIKETLIGALDETKFSDATLEQAISEKGLLSSGVFDETLHRKPLDFVRVSLYELLLLRPSISEGGYSRGKLTKDDIRAAIKAVYDKWGLVDPDTPKVRALHVR